MLLNAAIEERDEAIQQRDGARAAVEDMHRNLSLDLDDDVVVQTVRTIAEHAMETYTPRTLRQRDEARKLVLDMALTMVEMDLDSSWWEEARAKLEEWTGKDTIYGAAKVMESKA